MPLSDRLHPHSEATLLEQKSDPSDSPSDAPAPDGPAVGPLIGAGTIARTSEVQFYQDSRCILTIHADRSVTWYGDQSEAARGFWDVVSRLSPFAPVRPEDVQPGDWIQYTADDARAVVDAVVTVTTMDGRPSVVVASGARVWVSQIAQVRRGHPHVAS